MPLWTITPFVLLLLGIALLPFVVEHWWHQNRNKAIVSAALAIPTALYLVYLQVWTGQNTLEHLSEKLLEYASFMALLGSLYTVSGGIVVAGDLPARPAVNTLILGIGAVLANLVGTTGASMLLIRPLLHINSQRQRNVHVALFFIFMVCNTGGLLTPLGDPPLFLGFLNGVPFHWTFSLWPQWLVVNGLLLAIFFVWDTLAVRGEPSTVGCRIVSAEHYPAPHGARLALRLQGMPNFIFLAGIIGAVLLQRVLTDSFQVILPAAIMVAMGLLSWMFTPRSLREANAFSWEPIVEVAVIFIGIFVTMVPASPS